MNKIYRNACFGFAALSVIFMISCSSPHRHSGGMSDDVDSTVDENSASARELRAARPETGTSVYENDDELDDEKESAIEVSAPDDGTDYVLIVKDTDVMVANVYIRSGDTYELHLPNGEYEVYFYGGKRWNPKKMIGGRVGAFEQGDFMKDDEEVALENQKVTYTLEQTEDGNFEMTGCDEEDALD